MTIDSIKDIMETYTEVTKITTICSDISHRKPPLLIQGIDFTSIIEYAEYEEVIEFLSSESKQLSDIKSNIFHTYFTKNNFVYNIVSFTLGKKARLELVAGPILRYIPHNKSFDEITKNISYSIHKKRELLETISRIPLASNESIYQRGKLLLALCNMQKSNLHLPTQKVHEQGNPKNDILTAEYNDGTDLVDNIDELQDYYKFHVKLMNNILRGNVNGTIELIGEYGYLFWNMKALGNNYRNLKNRCIIFCTMACHYAIQSSVPYDRISHILGKSISRLEKSTNASDIVQTMSSTIKEYAHSVAALSDNQYSLHINRVLQYIRSHFSEKITLNDLAEYIHVNPIYLSSLIKKETHISLSHHINFVRIEESKILLSNTKKSIHEVAYEVGYNYQNHFNSIFKKLEGITPSEYRRKKGDINCMD